MAEPMDDYKRRMKALSFSDEAKGRLVTRLVEASTQQRAGEADCRRRHMALRPVAAAAALVAACALGGLGVAYAGGSLVSVSDFFGDVFQGAPAQTDVVNKVGRPLGAVAHADGISVSADAVIGDGKNVAVVYSITRDDGRPLVGAERGGDAIVPLMFSTSDLRIAGVTGSYGSSYFYDADPADPSVQYVQQLSMSGSSIVGKTAHVTLAGLSATDAASQQATPLSSGSWNLKFDINYEDSARALPAGEDITFNGLFATVSEASVSPIALNLRYVVHDAAGLPADAPSGKLPAYMEERTRQLLDLGTITITMADGSVVTIKDNGGGIVSEPRDGVIEVEKSVFLPQGIDVGRLAFVTVGGATLPAGA
ncbi:DUF4179 domain-containing protein [Olsenella massiliensis]|uniref:DUF4179 domain-containing protein n=1 Tax=Olsenella massiliensis TaxID=1622075 RepID=UPI0009EB5EC9|nr:DUF4179 domain-containing protein [Olsenella massiliensis]